MSRPVPECPELVDMLVMLAAMRCIKTLSNMSVSIFEVPPGRLIVQTDESF